MEELTSTKCGYLDGNSDFILAHELIGNRLPIYGQPMEVVSRSIDGQPIGGQSADKMPMLIIVGEWDLEDQ